MASGMLAILLLSVYPGHSQESGKNQPQIETGTILEEYEKQKVYRVGKIEIKGLKYFDPQIVQPLIPFGSGAVVSRDTISSTIRDLYKLGYFSSVETYTRYTENGIDITFVFQELPVVQRIEFEGNRAIPKEDIIKELGIDTSERMESGRSLPFSTIGPELGQKLSSIKKGLGRVLSIDEISQMQKKIVKLYEKKGYNRTSVSYYYRGNTLVFKIEEGSKAYVKQIKIIGNKAVSRKEVLSVMETSERSPLKLKFTPALVKETLLEDVERIRTFYINKGFLDVDVAEPIVDTDEKGRYIITIKIEEGERYRVNSVQVIGNDLYTEDELIKVAKNKYLKPGDFYDGTKVDFSKSIILEKYNKLGYIFANVSVNKLVDKQKKTVDIIYNIEKGNIYYVNKVDISGNYESRDATIRRELRLAPGDLFVKDALLRSQARLYRLGFYDMVGFEPNVVDDNKIDLTAQVSERFTGQISVGAGYSQLTGLSFFTSLRKGNFMGTGDTAGLSLSIGSRYRNNSFNYLHRWSFYKPIDMGVDLYDRYVDYFSFTSDRTGVSNTFSFEFREFWRTGTGFTIERGEFKNIQETASLYIKRQAGKYDLYSVFWFINRNSINNPIIPTEGSDITLNIKTGTGTRDFYKLTLSASKLFPDKLLYTDFVFSIKTTFGLVENIKKDIPLDELFFVGGDFTIRGFDWGMAGPRDSANNPMGARKQIVINSQLAHPISERALWWFVFTDAGKGFDSGSYFSNLFYSVGAGLKIITPFAPIELYYGKVLNPPDGVSGSRFGFILGTFF